MNRLAILLMLLLLATPGFAQDDEERGPDPEATEMRIEALESEIANLRRRVEEQDRRRLDEELREETLVSIYGDIGFRYHMLFESQTETINQPEYRLHFGVFGTAFEQEGQRLRYDMRLTTAAVDRNGLHVPTMSWLPLPGYGRFSGLSLDRYFIEFSQSEVFELQLGRFPTPYAGTEMLFDHDYHFQGLGQRIRFDRLLPEAVQRRLPRLELLAVQGYMAENRIGLPNPPSEGRPAYFGGQFRVDFAPLERPQLTDEGEISPEITSELEFRAVLGLHWYDGEESIVENLGVGYLDRTTNILDDEGNPQSDFMVGEVYGEVIFLRTRRARVRAWFHGLFNFHARPEVEGRGENNEQAFDAGIMWGMARFDQRWDFRVSFRYFLIESDALMPQFNSEILNTNVKGWEVALAVQVFPTVTVFGQFSMTEREDYNNPGFGRPHDSDPAYSSSQSTRIRFGIFLEF